MSETKVNTLKESVNKLEEEVEVLSRVNDILKEENKKLNAIIEQEKMQEQIIVSGYKMRYIITSDTNMNSSNINDELNYKMLQMSVNFIISLFKDDNKCLKMLCTEQFYNELMSTINLDQELELTEAQRAYKRINGKNLMKFSHITNASEYHNKYMIFIYFCSSDIEEMMDGIITFSINESGEIFVENFSINK